MLFRAPRATKRGWIAFPAWMAVALLISACSLINGPEPQPVACPPTGMLREGAELERFRPGSQRDITDLQLAARIVDGAQCGPLHARRIALNGVEIAFIATADQQLCIRRTLHKQQTTIQLALPGNDYCLIAAATRTRPFRPAT